MGDTVFQGGSIGSTLAKKKIVLDLFRASFCATVAKGCKPGHLNAMTAMTAKNAQTLNRLALTNQPNRNLVDHMYELWFLSVRSSRWKGM